MTVIPFPKLPARLPSATPLLAQVAAAMAHLGEPATAAEIRSALVAAGLLTPSEAEGAHDPVLEALADGVDEHGEPAFRLVELRGRPAWAFTPRFRTWLARQGVRSALRPLDPQ